MIHDNEQTTKIHKHTKTSPFVRLTIGFVVLLLHCKAKQSLSVCYFDALRAMGYEV